MAELGAGKRRIPFDWRRTAIASLPFMICPGTVFRPDTADANHLPQFTQVEGLVVDEGITFGDLKGTLDYFTREIFGKERATRYRPHFFPFTEPSCEVDVSCGVCGGKGCRFCKNTGWLEILGCGMLNPVFESDAHGYDTRDYTKVDARLGTSDDLRAVVDAFHAAGIRVLFDGVFNHECVSYFNAASSLRYAMYGVTVGF